MKVLMLLTNPFRPDPRVYEEAKTLVKDGYEVTILCWDRGEGYKKEEIVDGIKIVRFSNPSSYGKPRDFIEGIIKFYLYSMKWMRRKKFDYIHANDFDTLPLGILLKGLHRTKLVYDAHDHYASMIEDVLPHPIPWIVRKIEKILIKYVDARIAASEPLGRAIFSNLDFVPILNAKRLEEYNIPKKRVEEFRKKINPGNKFLIVYIGILKLWTPLPHIIEAVKDMEEVLLLIGGKGPHENEILLMIKDAKNIKYLGWVEKEKIPIYTLASDVIVLPSNPKKEYTRFSVPNKLMESLAAGKPMIAGLHTAGEEIAKECKSGFLCMFGDVGCIREKIKILIKNKRLREELGKNARKCAERKYNWSVMERRLIELYKKV